MSITVAPHTITREIPGWRDRNSGEDFPARQFEERDSDFPWIAKSGHVSAIGPTQEGAVAMVETILAAVVPRAQSKKGDTT